ncbi:MAG: hypothetical protein M3247_04895 [Thermoproteota archaeon]|nr:hypothetical protein [Thermoproteota archaeon]
MSSITERRREEAAMSVWSNRFLKSAIVQGSIVTGLAIIFVLGQMLYSSLALNIIQFLSLSFEGPAKWLFLGYILYIILAVAIATTALFYNHFEVNMHKGIRGYAWVHLIGMNIGGACVTITMIFAGVVGSGILAVITSDGIATQLKPNTEAMAQFILPIAAFATVLVVGAIAGGIVFITNYLGENSSRYRINTKRREF